MEYMLIAKENINCRELRLSACEPRRLSYFAADRSIDVPRRTLTKKRLLHGNLSLAEIS